jgi:hypothetical protein
MRRIITIITAFLTVTTMIWLSFVTQVALTPGYAIFNRSWADYLSSRKYAPNPPELTEVIRVRARVVQPIETDHLWVFYTNRKSFPTWICDAELLRQGWFWHTLTGACLSGKRLPHDPIVILSWWHPENTQSDKSLMHGLSNDAKITRLLVNLTNGEQIEGVVQDGGFVVVFPAGVMEPESLSIDSNRPEPPLVPATVDALDAGGNLLYHFTMDQLSPLRQKPLSEAENPDALSIPALG